MSYRVYIQTFGCQMNEYDTELVRSLLKDRGFALTSLPEQADVLLMNTCAIRENAHNRVYGHLAEWKAMKQSRHVVIGVLGCMAQNLKKELMESQPFIDVLAGPDSYRQLPDLLAKALERREQSMAVDLSEYETYESILPERTPGVNAWIAIMRGCDNFCSFCVVPYTRGRERSRPAQGILEETHALVAQGYKQVTLLGQNVNSYQSDGVTFAKLLSDVADVPGIERVRFTSPHPKDFPPALIDVVAHHPNVCRQIHLPLQSGSDRILDLMGRSYTRAEYRELAAVKSGSRETLPSARTSLRVFAPRPTRNSSRRMSLCRRSNFNRPTCSNIQNERTPLPIENFPMTCPTPSNQNGSRGWSNSSERFPPEKTGN